MGLVLTRLVDQTIVIGEGADAVEVTVAEIRGDKVRLDVAGPKSVKVDRKEVRQRIEAEKREAAASVTPGDVAGAGKEEP